LITIGQKLLEYSLFSCAYSRVRGRGDLAVMAPILVEARRKTRSLKLGSAFDDVAEVPGRSRLHPRPASSKLHRPLKSLEAVS
jgi:hypothetical protein